MRVLAPFVWNGVLRVLTLILASLCLVVCSTARSRMAAVCSSHQSARSELHCGERNLHQADSLKRFLVSHPLAGTRSDRSRLYRDARWLRRYALSMIHDARARMVPAIPHKSAWECIHRYEGSWTDSGDPYWGGLQMDRQFMATYGADMIRRFGGFANVWPVWAQMVVAERAYSSGRGYSPWPSTARMCGLL